MISPELAEQAWRLLLATTMAWLAVMLLRRVCRRWLGAERSFQLWLLAPLAMLASQLPHAAGTAVSPLSPLVWTIASTGTAIAQSTQALSGIRWQSIVLVWWLAGIVLGTCWAITAQWRFQRRLLGAALVSGVDARWPVWRAAHADVGPALVGAWKPRIVLPLDFEQRYDATERALILAHEIAHAERRDGCWSLCAQILLIACWFHPLAWWAHGAFRLDQELACDAAVLRNHRYQRRQYAQAMLKTQATLFSLPVGCRWSPRHPITERIAMLKPMKSAIANRLAGVGAIATAAMLMVGMVYAATPTGAKGSGNGSSSSYMLKIDVALGGRPASNHLSQCLKPGESVSLNGSDGDKSTWAGQFTVVPAEKGELEIRTKVDTRFEYSPGNIRSMSGQPIVRTMPGQLATIVFGEVVDGNHLEKLHDGTIKIELTPGVGC
ncbi:peptidase M56 [Dyella halodurans]|uniref:M56 family metallopeptidase n=1 Tax=Dyella halodurans TaxID=1920171 RepID=A0ABV9C6K7_9GAMM|nr:M56 family metallopeptidase [Dyella halodurans]